MAQIITAGEITARREKLKLSKAALARRAGLNSTTISVIESGRLVGYPVQLEKIARALEEAEKEAAADNAEGAGVE